MGAHHGRGRGQRGWRRARPSGRADHRGQRQPGVATQKAQKLIEGDQAACLIGEISSASGLAIAEVANRAQVVYVNTGCQLRPAARRQLQPLHVPRRGLQHDVHQDDRAVAAAPGPDRRRQVVFPDRRLRVRPRPVPGLVEVPRGERRGQPRQRHGADQHPRLQRLHPQDPPGRSGLRLHQSRRRRSDDLPQAVPRVRARLSARRRRHGHRAVLGRGPRIALGPLAEPVVPRARQRGLAGVHAEVHRAQRQAAREPGLGRVRRHPDPAQGDRRDRRHRQHGDRRVSRGRPRVRHPEGPSRQVPRLGPPAAAGDVRGRGQGAVRRPRTSGTSSRSSSRSPGPIRISS